MLGVLVAIAMSVAPHAQTGDGRLLYQQRCASCHGANFAGGPNAPALRGVGAAAVDFWMTTGRMPAAVPWVQVSHRGLQIPLSDVRAIEAYLAPVERDGPAVPPEPRGGDVARGRRLFFANCEHCHGADARGASISGVDWAPALDAASPLQIAEAIRTGPSQMPRFSATQLSKADVADVAAYVVSRREAPSRIPVSTSGPVPEGLIGWLAVGALCAAAFAYSKFKA